MHVQPDGIIVASTHAGLGNQLLHALSVAVMTHHLRRALNHRLRCTIQLQPWQRSQVADVERITAKFTSAFQHCDLQMAMPGSARTAREQLVGGHCTSLPTTASFRSRQSCLAMRGRETHSRSSCGLQPAIVEVPVPGLLKIEEMPYAVFGGRCAREPSCSDSEGAKFHLCFTCAAAITSTRASPGQAGTQVWRRALQSSVGGTAAANRSPVTNVRQSVVSSSFPQIFARSTNITTHRALLALSRGWKLALTHRNAVSNLMRLHVRDTRSGGVAEDKHVHIAGRAHLWHASMSTAGQESGCVQRVASPLPRRSLLCVIQRPDCDRSDAWR